MATKETVGSVRMQSDMRQIGALMMLTGACALFQPLVGVASTIGPDGSTPTEGIPFSNLMGGLCLITIGILAIAAGYMQTVHNFGHKWFTGFLILFTQTAFIPYVTGITNVSKISKSGVGFIPEAYSPSSTEVRFVGAMGILGIFSYGFAFVGAIAFMQFSLFAYQAGKPQDRPGSYYKGRLLFYCGMLFVAGFSQLLLGAFIISKFGNDLSMGGIGVSVYPISFPGIAVFVGLLQIINACWGIARSMGIATFGDRDVTYQSSMALGWLLQFVLQILVQVSYPMGDMGAGAAPQITAMSVGLNLMPAFLDWKSRTVPETISAEYYGLEDTSEIEYDEENQK